jgi:hypothetical protein
LIDLSILFLNNFLSEEHSVVIDSDYSSCIVSLFVGVHHLDGFVDVSTIDYLVVIGGSVDGDVGHFMYSPFLFV